MTNVWVVRAEYGKHTQDFIEGGYVAAGWLREYDLKDFSSKEDIRQFYYQTYPNENPNRTKTGASQIATFSRDIKSRDYIITPANNTKDLHYGMVEDEPLYYFLGETYKDGCLWPHRWKVRWFEDVLVRQEMSIPFQRMFNAPKTIIRVRQNEEFLVKIGVQKGPMVSPARDPYRVAIDRILQLHPDSFEEMIEGLMKAIGFEAEVVGKSNDGGVDVEGEMDISGLHTLRMSVQVKRWKSSVGVGVIKNLIGSLSLDGRGAVITTSRFTKAARVAADSDQLKRINLINGRQLVDMLIQHWHSEPLAEFRENEDLGLKLGLIVSG